MIPACKSVFAFRTFCLALGALVVAGCGQPETSAPLRASPPTQPEASLSQPVDSPPDQLENAGTTLAPVRGADVALHPESIQAEIAHANPIADQWDTEAFNERASRQLKHLAKDLCKEAGAQQEHIAALIDNSFVCCHLRPQNLQRVHQDHRYSVYRTRKSDLDLSVTEFVGIDGLQKAWTELRDDLDGAPVVDLHFKIVRVKVLEASIETTILVELLAQSETSIVQQSAQWVCEWKGELATPKLLRIKVLEFEEVRTQKTLFNDDTATVLAANSSYAEHLMFGSDYWRQTLDWRFGMEIAGPHGLSIADVNGDGLDDLFYCEMGGLPNRLFIQKADGTAEDFSSSSGLDFLEPTQSALFVDFDNDGDQDAVLASGRFVLFLENDGTGRFTRRSIHSTKSMARSLTAADFDSDNDVDIYVCGYFPRDSIGEGVGLGRPVPYHDANNGVANYLLCNDGDWQFSDVTNRVGLDVNNRRFTFAASWEDYDNDGDPDLYVANDFGRNNLYRNDNGAFIDVAAECGVEDISSGMSVSWADFDRDGFMDIYVGNMFSSAGNRITYQRQFRNTAKQDIRPQYQRHARGNSLFRNRGDGTFEDVSVNANVTMGRWSWSSSFADINNDGWDDLLVGNGMVTSADDPNDL